MTKMNIKSYELVSSVLLLVNVKIMIIVACYFVPTLSNDDNILSMSIILIWGKIILLDNMNGWPGIKEAVKEFIWTPECE